MSQPDVRKGMPSRRLDRGTFEKRFKSAFADPVFAPLQHELQAITDAAWDAYDDGRKAPTTRKAGPRLRRPRLRHRSRLADRPRCHRRRQTSSP